MALNVSAGMARLATAIGDIPENIMLAANSSRRDPKWTFCLGRAAYSRFISYRWRCEA
jgi:hypothetical protein